MSTTDTRAAFEAWMQTRPSYPFAGSFANLMWASWQAATEAAKATSVAVGKLPPMPEPFGVIGEYADEERDVWDYEQMHAYGQACAEAAAHKVWCAEVNCDAVREELAELKAARQPAPVLSEAQMDEIWEKLDCA